MPVKETGWAIVRAGEFREFIIFDEICFTYKEVKCRARFNDKQIPLYAKDNPVVRIVKVAITEIEGE